MFGSLIKWTGRSKKKKRYKPECGQNGVEFFFYFQPIVSFEWNAQTNRNILMFLLLQNIFHRLHFQPRVLTTNLMCLFTVTIHCEQTGCQSLVRSLKQTIWFFFVQPSINYLLSIPERPWFPISLLYQKIQKKFFFCKMNK